MGLQTGSLFVRRSIFINASPATVWQEFSTLERVRAWLGIGQEIHAYELQEGAEIRLSVDIDGTRRFFGGRVVCLEPEREISFESQWEPPHDWPVPTFWTIRLTPLYEGTQVELIHHGFERLGADAADNLQGYEEGWTVRHLKALRALVGPEREE